MRSEQLGSLFSAGLLTVGSDRRITRCHPSFAALIGWPVAALEGRPVDDVVEVGDKGLCEADGPPEPSVTDFRGCLRHADGSELAVVVRQFDHPVGSAPDATWLLVVITSTTGPEVSLIELDTGRSPGLTPSWAGFLRSVGHDLTNPLGIIAGMARTLADRQDDLPKDVRVGFAEAIARQAHHVQTAVDNLLSLDRVATGRARAIVEETDVTGLVEQVVDRMAERTPIELFLDDVTAVVDPTLCERIVENLLRNAVEHQTNEHPVAVHLSSTDGENLELAVLDRGPGIPAGERELIFVPYHRGDRSGVGLSIVRAFSRLHGGTVRVQPRPGGGSVFRVTLPLRVAVTTG